MESTVIAIMLASAVVFWNAPFATCLIPVNQTLRRHWRHILFVVVLLLLIASETHTGSLAIPATRGTAETYAAACRQNPGALPVATLSTPPVF